MTDYDQRTRFLAAGLSGLAGFVDALGFMQLGGFFVSFMSGNSTRLGVGVAEGSGAAAVAGGLILSFVLGVMVGSWLGLRSGARRRLAVLALVSGLLACAATLASLGMVWPAVLVTTLAMGAENAVFDRDGEVDIGLTYMTGALVKLGQRLVMALRGGPAWRWATSLMLWAGLVSGAGLGALAHERLGLRALWVAAVAATALTVVAARREALRP
ncbi:YoaK family protein [soil metagenome]